MRKFQQLSEYDYEDFESLDNVEKLSLCARKLGIGEYVRWIGRLG